MKTFIVYWTDAGDAGDFELDAPNLESAYEIANAEWPELSIIRIESIS